MYKSRINWVVNLHFLSGQFTVGRKAMRPTFTVILVSPSSLNIHSLFYKSIKLLINIIKLNNLPEKRLPCSILYIYTRGRVRWKWKRKCVSGSMDLFPFPSSTHSFNLASSFRSTDALAPDTNRYLFVRSFTSATSLARVRFHFPFLSSCLDGQERNPLAKRVPSNFFTIGDDGSAWIG